MARSHKITYEKQYSCEFESVVRGHHIYKRIWKPVVGEKLKCKHDTREEAQLYDEFAVGTYLPVNDGEEELVGHVPIELSFLLCKYLARDGCCLEFTPTGSRYSVRRRTCGPRTLQSDVKWKGIDMYFKE